MIGKYSTYLVTLLFLQLSAGCATFDALPDDPNETGYDWSLLNPAIAPAQVKPLLPEPARERPQSPLASARTSVRETPSPELGVRLGMLREEVLEVWGEPVAVRRNAPDISGGEYGPESVDERWVYRAPPHQPAHLPQTGIVYFQSGRVVGWKIR